MSSTQQQPEEASRFYKMLAQEAPEAIQRCLSPALLLSPIFSEHSLVNTEIKQDTQALLKFIQLSLEDPNLLSPELAMSMLADFLSQRNDVADLNLLNNFFESCGSVSSGVRFLKDCCLDKNKFSFPEDLQSVAEICSYKKTNSSAISFLSSALKCFIDSPASETLPLFKQILENDNAPTFLVFPAFTSAARYLTDVHTKELINLAINCKEKAAEFFIQYKLVSGQISLDMLLNDCRTSDKSPLETLRKMRVDLTKFQTEALAA